MREQPSMLFLLLCLLFWTQMEAPSVGGCGGAIVSISGGSRVLPAGAHFSLSCEFTCLSAQHIPQLWRESGHQAMPLINVTSALPNLVLVLTVSSATEEDTGYYSCMTQPPDTISPQVLIQITDNLPTSTLNHQASTTCCDSSQQLSRAAAHSSPGLQGQIWFWTLLGKTAVLLLSLTSLVVKYKKG